ncbi:MAG: adenylate kinase [Acidimicrobiia bacterium]|nr:adenylate kinase [Acidimicrobiia bacterium]MBV9040900.1 adenylate kinase [Acidimicrobiia bacterium]MBV9283486.1 adenylate kinase [Acidimicrobiia bacterium]
MVPGTRLVVLGKQGAGKGTQAVRLARHYAVPHVSTGDIFRAAVRSGSEFGKKAREFMDAGELVPDDVVVGVVQERLSQNDARLRGFILDGFPRTVFQAEALDELLPNGGVELVIDLEVPTEVVLKRLASRRVCVECGTNYSIEKPPSDPEKCDVCGGKVVQREDDTVSAIRRRLELYEEQTAPLIAWYMRKDKLVTVDGIGDPDKVTARLIRAIDLRLRRGADA